MRPDEVRRELRRKVLIVGLLFTFIAMVYLVFNVSRFDQLSDVNAIDYAQIARNLARGEGFTTSFIKPLGLTYETSVENHIDLTYPPLHIGMISMMMRALGENDRAVSHASGLAFLLTIPVLFTLAVRLFDWRTAVLGTLIFGTHLANLGYAVSGLEASLLTLLVTAMLLLLHCAAGSEKRELLWVAAAAVMMGLIYLTKYVWLGALIPAVAYLIIMKPERRLARVGVFIAVMAIVAAPWLYRNYAVAGNPFFTLRWHELPGQTRAYPANTIYRQYAADAPSYLAFAASNPRAIFEKIRGGLNTFYGSFHGLAGLFVAPFFLVGILVRLGDDRLERLRYLLYGLLVVVSVVLAFFIASPRLIAPLGGFMTILAVAFFWRLLDARTQALEPRPRIRWLTVAVGLLLLLHLQPFVTAITPDEPAGVTGETPLEQAMTQLQQMVDGPVLTDAPWTVAWMAGRDAVWLPQTEADLRRMEERVGRFNWLLLSPTVARMAASERMEMWANAWVRAQQGDAEVLGFTIAARLGDGRWILMRRQVSVGEATDEGTR
ncbi:MAG: ArnT family glycosyltransferase [Armatimonadota bacterium]|jgi:4-amino-4-deoxy-L-arabinose transferase-like glycosyltransferase